jgi:GNAT superfamily N-acetyltransferase
MDILIHFATLSDLKDIQHLNHLLCLKENKEFDSTINKDFAIQKVGEEYFTNRIQNDCALVAIVEDKVVGYLIGAVAETPQYRIVSKLAELENMFVLEEYRNIGIGKKLVEEFIQWCKHQNVERTFVIATSKNTSAIEFYSREGFQDSSVTLEREI